jgi:hypothetical protein
MSCGSVTRGVWHLRAGRHRPRRSRAYPSGIEDESLEAPDSTELPAEDDSLEIHPDAFMVKSGFLRAGSEPNVPPPAPDGPLWTFDEADERAHDFLRSVAGERDIANFLDDPVEHARANGLMLLFSEAVQESFRSYLARMPEPRVVAWTDLIAGGASSEAFGPLTLQEKLDEKQVDEALQVGRRQRAINLLLAVVALVGLVGGAYLLSQRFFADETRSESAFQFDLVDETPEEAARGGGPPITEPSLTTALATTVAVAAGDGPEATRITVAPFSVYPYPPGSIRASLFQYAGRGHVVFVGPEGFTDNSCLRASVVTAGLRPLDTVTYGSCGQPVGRPASVGCLGPSAVLLDLVVPPGEVTLPEGGTGFAEQVRVQLIGDDPDYEVLSLRGTIEVAATDTVAVPRFGGEIGEELTFDLGADRIGRCTITGDLPGRS